MHRTAVIGWFVAAAAQAAPYADPSQLDVPWPAHSHRRQPWRAFCETRPGTLMQTGLGINYNVRSNDELAVRLLAETGFRRFRIEIGWSQVNDDETGFRDEPRLRRLLELCRRHGVRPLILLNAHHGVPGPVRFWRTTVAADAAAGDRAVRLASVDGLEPGRSGLSNLSDYWAAECLVTAVEGDACTLSRPLPKALAAGDQVLMATLRYLPLHPVGHPEFERTAEGWVKYARTAVRLVREAGIEAFDVEIWNELSFGSRFTSIQHYYDPCPIAFAADFLRPGGQAWELARRTIDAVSAAAPEARCIWGFSNTTFFHCPVAELPPGCGGQSYHPYGTGTRRLPESEQHPDRTQDCLDGFCPHLEMRLPEGWAHTFVQTESLMRLINPSARRTMPPQTVDFRHYLTEHGVLPAECGITDEAGCWELKSKAVLRAFPFWLNKGIEAVYWYCAAGDEPGGFGLLPTNLTNLPQDASWDDVATPPMRAVRRLYEPFANAEALAEAKPLVFDLTPLDDDRYIFAGQGGHHGLKQSEAVAVLPFQTGPRSFVIAVYEMTYDITTPAGEHRYRLAVSGLPAGAGAARLIDPLSGAVVPVDGRREGDSLAVELPLTDTPRLLLVEP